MKKVLEKYKHDTGITFDVTYTYSDAAATPNKALTILTSGKQNHFVFNQSDPATIKAVGNVLVEISNFVEGL